MTRAVGDERRTALVAGGTSGIGLAAVRRLVADGWWVCAAGTDQRSAATVGDELGDDGMTWVGDLTEDDAPARLVHAVVDARGRLDAVVNSAGQHVLATLPETEVTDLDRILAVNLRTAVLLAQAALVPMRAQAAGVIVNVSSEAGLVAVPGQVAYNVSKAGLTMLTRSLAADHAREGIRAVGVAPGTTRTPLVEAAIASADDPQAHEARLASSRPAGRLGTPDEIAAAIAFACSDEVSYLNGSEIVIDGGYTAV